MDRDLLTAKVRQLDRNGFVVLEALVDPALIDTIHAEILGMVDRVRGRDLVKLRHFVVPAGARPGDKFDVAASLRRGQDPAARVEVQVPQDATPGAVLQVPAGPDREHGPIHTGHGGLQETERYTMHLPWRRPFAQARPVQSGDCFRLYISAVQSAAAACDG